MSLATKYRPDTFEGIAGSKNKEVAKSLAALVAQPDPPHAYLFHGPSGCGKTTLGRLVATGLGCSEDDFREVDSADFRGIDTIREIRRNSHFKGLRGERRVWLIDECHKMTNDAQNALLKGLEDPPSHCYYVLATTEPEKLLPTIVSRCVGFSVYPLADDEMLRLLHRTAGKEDKPQPRAVLQSIVAASHGRPRFALSSLEKLIADPEAGEAALASVELVKSKSIDLCRVLMNSQGWKAVSHILSELKDEDVESIRRAVMGYCANVLLRGENDKAALIMDEFVAPFYDSGYPGLVHACYTVVRGN